MIWINRLKRKSWITKRLKYKVNFSETPTSNRLISIKLSPLIHILNQKLNKNKEKKLNKNKEKIPNN